MFIFNVYTVKMNKIVIKILFNLNSLTEILPVIKGRDFFCKNRK